MGRCMNCLNACVQIVRWLPVVIVAAALSWGYYAYVYELCIKTVENNVQRALYLLFFHIFLGLFLASYYQTIFSPIRKPPDAFYPPDDILEELESCKEDPKMCSAVLQRYADHNQLQLMTRGYDGGIRFCFKCKCVKPDRSHHCSMCGQCVLKFDHHCPWVNTCVNFHNYKFFLLFLGWGFVFCVYIMLTDMPYFIDFWVGFGGNMKAARFHLLFMVFVSGMFALSLSCLFFYHLWLTAKNRSTVEGFRAPLLEGGQYDKNAFNHGIRANYREVFGPNWRLWILPVYSSCGSGSRFRVRGVDAMSYHQADAAVAPTASLVAPNASAQPPPSSSASSLPHSDPTHCCSSARVSASETV